MSLGRPRVHRQQQSWSARISRAESQWQHQMSSLVDAYLRYMNGVPAEQEIGQEVFDVFYIDVFGESSVSGLRHPSFSWTSRPDH